ncbi:hypothetical protein FLAN108750_07615 [Flavobacterium antarcticum]|uniref:hypothetical protein n=1 Tax=Flavobacterium antarcticum TaxID=271155 RepID=UPI0003B641BE|nr:hypothetical protein [Flavobacterium antarcticum]
MLKLSKYKKTALIIFCLPIIALLLSYITKSYRASNLRYIYLIGISTVYLFWLSSFVLGIINSLFIVQIKNEKIYIKMFWIFISLLPIIYISISLILVIVADYYFNDDIILPNGERIDNHYYDEIK